MRKLAFTVLALALAMVSFGQEEKTEGWSHNGNIGLNFSQSSYTNWAPGGQNTLAWLGTINYNINYIKGNFKWDNSLGLALGYSIFDFDKKPIKTDDRIEFTSLAGLKATEKLNYSLELAFRSQFARGYDYKVDSTNYTSKWLAPAYITLGLGMEWVPNEHFSVNFAPLTGRITIVNDSLLASQGAYGVNELDKYDEVTHLYTHDSKKMVRYEFGARLAAKMKYTIFENVDFESKLELFSNYLNHPQYIDVDWQNLLVLKVNSWLNCNIGTHLVYDYDIKFPVYDAAGEPQIDPNTGTTLMTTGSKIQFKEVLAIGFLINLK
ncbi:MAG: DUF3078 domain-containing protein [Bacteroidales bacterium]|nr:DUF3078 domain-containing protein [Bacteroidales bacterium]